MTHIYSVNWTKPSLVQFMASAVRQQGINKHIEAETNPRQFADDLSKWIFFNIEKVSISLKISQKFVLKFPINNIPAFVQIMAWRRPGTKTLPEPMMVINWRRYASLGLIELNERFLLSIGALRTSFQSHISTGDNTNWCAIPASK